MFEDEVRTIQSRAGDPVRGNLPPIAIEQHRIASSVAFEREPAAYRDIGIELAFLIAPITRVHPVEVGHSWAS
jgi:hypothetical protein